MGFWHILDKVVGFIPVIGTVKDAIEAGVEEVKGNHAAAREKLIEAGVDLVADIVTVATLGAGAEVAAAGKMAAEEVLKQAAKGTVKTTAEATALGLGKRAGAVVAARVAAKEALRRKGKPDNRPKTPENPPREPKRGHHVINNGVIRIFRDIIERFFEEHRGLIFLGRSYRELVEEGIINEAETPILMASHDQPLPPNICREIEMMVAYTPRGETHTDENDVIFGVSKVGLLNAVIHIVSHVFTSLQETGRMPDLNGGFLHQMQSMIGVIGFITQEPTDQNGIYVDNQALRWWLVACWWRTDGTIHSMQR